MKPQEQIRVEGGGDYDRNEIISCSVTKKSKKKKKGSEQSSNLRIKFRKKDKKGKQSKVN